MTTTAEFVAAEIENIAATRRACGNKSIHSNAFADADFAAIAARKIADYRARAEGVKGEAAKGKWNALADAWQEALDAPAAEAETVDQIMASDIGARFDISRTEATTGGPMRTAA